MKFKKPLFILLVVIGLVSCKKAIEDATQQAAINQITGGKWIITSYVEGSTNITSIFTGWETRFKDDRTLITTRNTDTVRGTWSWDIFAQTFTTTYTTTPLPSPLQKIAGTWKIVGGDSTVGKYKRFDPAISDTARMTTTRF